MELLGLDPATRCGWAITPADVVRIELGSWQSPKGVSEGERAAFLAQKLDAMLEVRSVGYALVEKPMSAPGKPKTNKRLVETKLGFEVEEDQSFTGTFGAMNILWAIHGAVVGVLGVRGIPFRVVSSSTWRSFMFGKGNGKMPAQQSKARSKHDLEKYHNVDVRNSDEAEAGMIALMLHRQHRRWMLEDKAIGGSSATGDVIGRVGAR